MQRLSFTGLLLSFALAYPRKRQSDGIYVPFYDASANGYTAPARGWNSYGIQANPSTWQNAGFDLNDYQCVHLLCSAASCADMPQL